MVLTLRNKKMINIGNSYGFIVSKEFVKNKDLNLKKLYTIVLTEEK